MDHSEGFFDLGSGCLEDSWVSRIAPSEQAVSFEIDAVLDPGHPRHGPRKPGEQHRYLTGRLTVSSRGPVGIRLSGRAPDISPMGQEDVGTIDSFAEESPGVWLLEGDWGSARVTDLEVTLRFDWVPDPRRRLSAVVPGTGV